MLKVKRKEPSFKETAFPILSDVQLAVVFSDCLDELASRFG